ncbi:MAG: type IV pilus assembly protein PilM [Desulfobacterales bacterium]|nr:type IV pilus assembly protein PilM [Desulfobacterales bacterium]
MILGKKNQIAGLDIGSRIIKVAEASETSKGFILKKFGTLDVPHGAIDESGIKNVEVVANSIRQLFKNTGIKISNVAVAIGGYSVIVKTITVQTMTEEQLHNTIHIEAEQYIPFDMSDVNLDFQIVSEAGQAQGQMKVLLVAAKKEIVSTYIKVVEKAGLTPMIVDVDAFALQNVYEHNYDTVDGKNEHIALIDIGASKTSLNILWNKNSVFMRDVPLGCSQIDERIMSEAKCSFDEAEAIKLGRQKGKLVGNRVKEIVTDVVSDWCTEIRRALEFYYSSYPEHRIKEVVLSGGGGNIKEFRDLLKDQTGTEVKLINPFQKIAIDEGRLDGAGIRRVASQAAICLGLATRRVDDK